VASPLQGVVEDGTALATSNLALTNTVIALLASTVCAFVVSPLLSGRLIRPVDIQNATLAGGVAIGATANLAISPGVALLIGSVAGIVSTIGFCRVQPFLLEKIGLHDSCGIHNLHGMPSIIGATFSIFGKYMSRDIGYGAAAGEPLIQLGGMGVTIAVAMVSGALTGLVMKLVKEPEVVTRGVVADDRTYWEVADNFAKEDADIF